MQSIQGDKRPVSRVFSSYHNVELHPLRLFPHQDEGLDFSSLSSLSSVPRPTAACMRASASLQRPFFPKVRAEPDEGEKNFAGSRKFHC